MCELEHLPTNLARDSLLALLTSDHEDNQRRAVACLAEMLSSRDRQLRQKGYVLFREGIEDALFQSCLNYGALVHGFTHPLLCVLEEAIEHWARSSEGGDNVARQ